MMPSEVVTAHAEYSVMPTKYRLSNTLTGSACHCDGSGGPACAPPLRWPRCGGGAGRIEFAEHSPPNNPGWVVSPAAFAAATCASTVSAGDCPAVAATFQPAASPIAATRAVTDDFMVSSFTARRGAH